MDDFFVSCDRTNQLSVGLIASDEVESDLLPGQGLNACEVGDFVQLVVMRSDVLSSLECARKNLRIRFWRIFIKEWVLD